MPLASSSWLERLGDTGIILTIVLPIVTIIVIVIIVVIVVIRCKQVRSPKIRRSKSPIMHFGSITLSV